MIQPNHRRRTYNCRGRLRTTHLDGSPKCTVPNLYADWLESEVWHRIEEIINDPNRLERVLQETIESLRNREEELSARIKPIDERLAQIEEQKSRLAEDWVKLSLGLDRYRELQQGLQSEENRLMSVRTSVDPAQIEELKRTQGLLRFWERDIEPMAWNTETEDGQMFRVVDQPHKTVLSLVGFEDNDISDVMHFPATKRELLDLLQVRLVAFEDRVEVKAIFPVEPIDRLLCTSA